jgi:hypothetical protein
MDNIEGFFLNPIPVGIANKIGNHIQVRFYFWKVIGFVCPENPANAALQDGFNKLHRFRNVHKNSLPSVYRNGGPMNRNQPPAGRKFIGLRRTYGKERNGIR